jgi:hypothetical protein
MTLKRLFKEQYKVKKMTDNQMISIQNECREQFKQIKYEFLSTGKVAASTVELDMFSKHQISKDQLQQILLKRKIQFEKLLERIDETTVTCKELDEFLESIEAE